MDSITKEQTKNGVSYKDTEDVDADSFLNYLHRISQSEDSGSTADTQMMSAVEFYKNF